MRRPFLDIAFDALRGVTTAVFGQSIGGMRGFTQPAIPVSSSPAVIQAGEEVSWDRRDLPKRKQISVECGCGGQTYRFTILRDHGAFQAEREGLGSHFTALKDTLRVATGWNRVCLLGKCIKCGSEIEGYINLNH